MRIEMIIIAKIKQKDPIAGAHPHALPWPSRMGEPHAAILGGMISSPAFADFHHAPAAR
jgi:hypothetical protein